MTQPWPLASWRCTTSPASPSHRKTKYSSKSNRSRNAHSNAITITDIPHIVSLICDNLSPRDIWNCYRVNTTWRNMFGPHRFREVKYVNLSATQTWDILENAHHIRSLEIDPTEGEYFVHKPLVSWPSCTFRPLARCTNLRELYSSNRLYDCDCRSNYKTCRRHKKPHYFHPINLISCNPMLERLTFCADDVGMWKPSLISHHILRPLSRLRHLRYLQISRYRGPINQSARSRLVCEIFRHLPMSLEELDILCGGCVGIPPLDVRVPTTNLRRIKFEDNNAWYMIPLVKNSPLLEEISFNLGHRSELIEIISSHCPRIHSVYFYGGIFFEISRLQIISGAYKELRSITLTMLTSTAEKRLAFTVLLSQYTNTLESLCLFSVTNDIGLRLGTMLRTFPNLRSVELGDLQSRMEDWIHLSDLVYDRSNGFVPTSPSAFQHIPWACRNLEKFSCYINSYSGSVRETALVEERACIARQVGLLYQELRTLKRLTQLDLTWSPDGYGRQMPQEIGLELMIQHGQPEKYRMMKEDLLWMNLCWHTLAQIKETEAIERLRIVSGKERSGCISSCRLDVCSSCGFDYLGRYQFDKYNQQRRNWWEDPLAGQQEMQCEDQLDDFHDWPLQVNEKTLRRAKQLYSNQIQSYKHIKRLRF